MLKLYQNTNFRGYSITIDGNVNKDDGNFLFNSLNLFLSLNENIVNY